MCWLTKLHSDEKAENAYGSPLIMVVFYCNILRHNHMNYNQKSNNDCSNWIGTTYRYMYMLWYSPAVFKFSYLLPPGSYLRSLEILHFDTNVIIPITIYFNNICSIITNKHRQSLNHYWPIYTKKPIDRSCFKWYKNKSKFAIKSLTYLWSE